jgi:Flp pilus assembly protein TadG
MQNTGRKSTRNQRGSAMLEFALVGTVLLLLLFGIADFGRLFYAAIEVANAAAAGANYGAFSSGSHVTDTTGISDAAKNEAPELTLGVNSTAVCQDSSGNTETCSTAGAYKYVRVTVTYTFNTLFKYPLIPASANLSKTVMMRYA